MQRWKYIFFLLLLIVATVWLAVFAYPENNLDIIACDVGQGDAFLIQKGTTQIVIDGGPNSKVINCLSDNIPFWDREIEMVVSTHPQKDHYEGLIDVFRGYKVRYFLANGLDSSSTDYQVLKNQVTGGGVDVINPYAGQQIRLGLIYLDILNPTRQFLTKNSGEKSSENELSGAISESDQGGSSGVLGAYTSKLDPNLFSVVVLLHYKDFDALFTGDIDPGISDAVAKELFAYSNQSIEYIKVPHHGSKNGMSQSLLDAVNPRVAVISVGKNNSYGHPSKEILDMLTKKNVRILRTDEMGEIDVESDGEKMWLK